MRVPEITPDDLAKRLLGPEDQRPVLLDVRRPRENALVALPDSEFIPLYELEARKTELEPVRGREIVVYCHHGVRSLTGARILIEAGFDAKSLSGGIHLWARDIDKTMLRY